MTNSSYPFSQRVDNYIKYRPRYPNAILDLLRTTCQLTDRHTIADVGSGPGFLARLFLEHDNPVYGIEPDPDMRAGAEYFLQGFPKFTSIPGTAEATTLPDHGVDFVTAGQAFHWFNRQQARKEFARIPVPLGWIVLVWNLQRTSGTPFLVALQEFWETRQFWKRPAGQSLQLRELAQAYRKDRDLVRRE